MKEYVVVSPLKIGQEILEIDSTVREVDMVAGQAEDLIRLGAIELKQPSPLKKQKEKAAD